MKCPHCLENFHDERAETEIPGRSGALQEWDNTTWKVRARLCPACGHAIIELLRTQWGAGPLARHSISEHQVWPKSTARAPLPIEVTDPYASDYREACNVLVDSAKASAALGRRCLQGVLRDKAGVKKSDLYKEIEEVINSGKLPADLAEALHHVRVIGNFAAHPEKSVNTGAIVDVEPGEAEWTLDVLESLFDFYFVRPARLAARKAEINKKLGEAGKPPLP
jgi:hypothetical protein